MKNAALALVGFTITLSATLLIYINVNIPYEYQLTGAVLLTLVNVIGLVVVMFHYVPAAEATRTHEFLQQQCSVTVCHRATRKLIDKKLGEGCLKAHPIKNSTHLLDRFLDGEAKGTWVSCGLPGTYSSFRTGSHILNGWNKAIVFDIDPTKIDTPKGWKRSTGRSQLIIRDDFQFPPGTKIRIFERQYLFSWLEVDILIVPGLPVTPVPMATPA
ncbi:hypothetical protein M2399_006578 [Pseudomonas sp. BIGb0450]|jgi:hypothetical protein|uniref:hypothetical protein n=1 Tax=unclassified Pseudomonas TaxID=196821 RepID=UPI002166E36C|nr:MULTISPECIES: hypothetical protein [unclassified Pseudomonas]MCS3418568.1 hypothetical protein [Pseudomonas sp. BIGb0558]MCS3441106.1 hypothetical protein [Pseudomonas sp. BIGb0450]